VSLNFGILLHRACFHGILKVGSVHNLPHAAGIHEEAVQGAAIAIEPCFPDNTELSQSRETAFLQPIFLHMKDISFGSFFPHHYPLSFVDLAEDILAQGSKNGAARLLCF
jgi:hypothetical protein